MQLIRCPWCGPREEVEYHYGGQAHVPLPDDPAALSDAQWASKVRAGDQAGLKSFEASALATLD